MVTAIPDYVLRADARLPQMLKDGDPPDATQVVPANRPPEAEFTTARSARTIYCTDRSLDVDGAIVSWLWDFGDGTTSIAQNPSHTYDNGGTYTITLTVTDDNDATATVAHARDIERAVIDATLLAGGESTTDATSIVSTSITPEADAVIYAAVSTAIVGTPATPTATGCGLTWVQVATRPQTSRRVTVFRARGVSPTTGAVTFSFGGETQTSFEYAIVQCSGADVSGDNGAGATLQPVSGGTGTATTFNVTLAALEHPNNLMLVFVLLTGAADVVPDADFTELYDDNITSNGQSLQVEYAVGLNVCDPTFASNGSGYVALEVKAR